MNKDHDSIELMSFEEKDKSSSINEYSMKKTQNSDDIKLIFFFKNFFEKNFSHILQKELLKLCENFKAKFFDQQNIFNIFNIILIYYSKKEEYDLFLKNYSHELDNISDEFEKLTDLKLFKKYYNKSEIIQQKIFLFLIERDMNKIAKYLLKNLKFQPFLFCDWFYENLFQERYYKIIEEIINNGIKSQKKYHFKNNKVF